MIHFSELSALCCDSSHAFQLFFFFWSSFYPSFSHWILESKLVRFRFISSRPKWWSQLLCFAVWQRWECTFCSTIQSVLGLKGDWVILGLRYWMQLVWNTECNPKSSSLFFMSTKQSVSMKIDRTSCLWQFWNLWLSWCE